MPRVKNPLLHGASGSFKKEYVYRTYKNKTYLSSFPDMSKVKLSPAQRASNQLSTRHQAALHYLLRFKTLSNAIYMSINEVSKPTATRDLKEMINLGVIFCLGKGAGAKYQLKVIIAPEEIEKNPLTQELE